MSGDAPAICPAPGGRSRQTAARSATSPQPTATDAVAGGPRATPSALVVTRRRNARACRKRPLSASASPRESPSLSPLPRVRCGQSARRTGPLAARSAGTRGGVAGDAPSSSWDRGAYRHRVRGPILSRSTSPAPSCRGRRAGRARERASASSRSTEVDRQSRPARRLLAANVHQPVSSRRGGAPTGGMPSGYATLGPGAAHEREASPSPVAARPERESARRQPRRVHAGGGDPAPDGPGADARRVLLGGRRGAPDPGAGWPGPAPDARATAHGRSVVGGSRLGPGQGDHRAHGRTRRRRAEQRLALLRRLSDDERETLRGLLAKALATPDASGPSDSSAQADLEPEDHPAYGQAPLEAGAPATLGRPRNVGRASAPELVEVGLRSAAPAESPADPPAAPDKPPRGGVTVGETATRRIPPARDSCRPGGAPSTWPSSSPSGGRSRTRPGGRAGGGTRACARERAPGRAPRGSGTRPRLCQNFLALGRSISARPPGHLGEVVVDNPHRSRRQGPQAGTPHVCHPVPTGPPAGWVKTPRWRVAVRSVA